MWILKIAAVVLTTAVLGTVAILTVLISPGGRLIFPICRLWSRLISAACGVRYRVTGGRAVQANRTYVFMTNHASQFDIPALVEAIPVRFRFVAKRVLFWIPVFGWALYLAGFIGIDRANREKAIRSLDRAVDSIRGGDSVVIFAEGTRSSDGRLLPFKKGGFVMALKAGVPIVPVAIRGSRGILPKGSLRIRSGTIQVRIGAPIPTTAFTLEDKEALIGRVRDSILEMISSDAPERGGSQVPPTPGGHRNPREVG